MYLLFKETVQSKCFKSVLIEKSLFEKKVKEVVIEAKEFF